MQPVVPVVRLRLIGVEVKIHRRMVRGVVRGIRWGIRQWRSYHSVSLSLTVAYILGELPGEEGDKQRRNGNADTQRNLRVVAQT